MEAVFLKLFNMSITASWLVLAILILRLILRKAPKFIRCILWGLVGLRLIFPFSIESILSLIPSSEPLPQDFIYTATPTVNTGFPVIDHAIDPILTQSLTPAPLTSVNPTQIISFIASAVWICGLMLMLVYMLVSYLRVRIKVREAVIFHNNVYLCDHIASPFILGIITPKIYLPSNMSPADIEYVISHENAHLKRCDHWWKPLGFLILCVYWFNPVMWVAYVLLCRDIELACDEKVIKQMDAGDKKEYTNALLSCSIPRRMISACPLAFGEVGVKNRVKNVLSYKKPAFWIILIAVIACIVTAVCFLTDPKEDGTKSIDNISKEDYISVSNVSYATDAPEDKVEIEFKSAVVHTDKDNLIIEWKNHTDSALVLERDWELYKETDGQWERIRNAQDFETVGSIRLSKRESTEETYTLDWQFFSVGKSYRLEQGFSLEDSPETRYTAYVEFEIGYEELQLGVYTEGTYSTGETYTSNHMLPIIISDTETYNIMEYRFVDLSDGKLSVEATDQLIINGEQTNIFEISYGETKMINSPDGTKYTLVFPDKEPSFSYTCVGGTSGYVSSYESALTAAGYFGDIDSLFTSSLNAYEMYKDKLNHLPIRKVESYEELESFIGKYRNKLALTERTNDHRSFEETVEKYNEEFFENNLLFLVYVQSKNKHTSFFNIDSVYNDGESLCVNLTERSYSAEEGEKSGYIAVIATSKKDVGSCKSFDAILDTVNYDIKITSGSDLDHTHEFGRFDDLYGNGYFHTAPKAYGDYMGEYIDVEIEGGIYRVWESYAVMIRDFLKYAPYDPEKVCDCPYEIKVLTAIEGQPAEFELNLSLAFARCNEGQIELSEKQVADIMSYLSRLYPEHGEDYLYPEDHTHSLSAYPLLREDTNYIPNADTDVLSYYALITKDGEDYYGNYGDYCSVYNILNNAYYDEKEVCDCPAEFVILSDRYEVNLTHGFVRCNEGQVKLTPHQISEIKSVIENLKTEKEYQDYWRTLIPSIGSKYIPQNP